MIIKSPPMLQRANAKQSPPAPPPVVAHVLDAGLSPDAFKTYDANGLLWESGISRKSKQTLAKGSVAHIVVGKSGYDAIEQGVAEMRATFERHDAFDRDALAAAAAKRTWKNRCRVIRREMWLHRHMLTAMAKYVGQVPMVPRAEGDDYDSRLAAYVTLFNKGEA
jgi:hypothetical protein